MEDEKRDIGCYIRSNPTQRCHRKRIKEIWKEWIRFKTTSQRLADQVWTIIKKGSLSDLEIRKIHQEINRKPKQDTNTITDTLNAEKQEHFNRNEPQSNKNRNSTHWIQIEGTLTQEEEMDFENLKRIMSGEKTTLPSLINQDWRTVKEEIEKKNGLLLPISMKNVMEVNEQIYTGAK